MRKIEPVHRAFLFGNASRQLEVLGCGEGLEHRPVAGVEGGDQQRMACNERLAALREMSDQGHRGQPAGTSRHQVQLVGARDGADREDRLQGCAQVGLQTPIGGFWPRVLPADREDLKPLLDQVSQHAVLRLEIEGVVFVDLRRDQQDRPQMNVFGLRRKLNELELRVSEDDRAGCCRQGFADHVGAGLDLPRHPAVGLQIQRKVLQPLNRRSPATRFRALDRRRVQRQVGRRQRRLHLVDQKLYPQPVRCGDVLCIEPALHMQVPRQIELHQPAQNRAFAPERISEPAVARAGFEVDLLRLAQDVDGLSGKIRKMPCQ